MKEKEIYQLKKGDKINHKHYGICLVEGIVIDFGVKIIPESEDKQELLKKQADTVKMFQHMPKGTPLLETSFKLITHKIS